MPDARERHERLTGRPLAHPAMANACVLWWREQLIAHSSALTATSQLSRVFLDGAHVVFPMLTWIENGFVRLENPLSGERFTTWELFLARKGNRTTFRAKGSSAKCGHK